MIQNPVETGSIEVELDPVWSSSIQRNRSLHFIEHESVNISRFVVRESVPKTKLNILVMFQRKREREREREREKKRERERERERRERERIKKTINLVKE